MSPTTPANQWYFRDPQNQVQGPFDDASMRAWLEAGYLAADLPICNGNPKGQFRKLSDWFPNAIHAFTPPAEKPAALPDREGEWYFVDKNGKVQGPFGDFHMRQWHLAGYFEPTLQLMNQAIQGSSWVMLRDLFPSITDAFLVGGSDLGPPAAAAAAVQQQQRPPAERFDFPEWLPVPPRFRGVKKTYPSELHGGARRKVNITDVHGKHVNAFAHAQ